MSVLDAVRLCRRAAAVRLGKRWWIEVREPDGLYPTPFTRTVCGLAFSPDDRELVVVGVGDNGDIEAALIHLRYPDSTVTVRLAGPPPAGPVRCAVGWPGDGPIAVLRNGHDVLVLDVLTAKPRGSFR
ncbi:hypothetical protein [Allorhizocola rhizosphaerae]|uniref:hypothetical protein n=1 Tax=Allorhizocola rhizosphaerae TaxID=1872709 RepID=UPI000E3EC81E|nr:hypothetical protein [Allorhizocola rhizosphaerae]